MKINYNKTLFLSGVKQLLKGRSESLDPSWGWPYAPQLMVSESLSRLPVGLG